MFLHCGLKHFNLIYKSGLMKLSEARLTKDEDNLYFKNMIHVASLNVFWFAKKKVLKINSKHYENSK